MEQERFGRYIICGKLGGGGTADVYLAELDGPRGFKRKVAIKRFKASLFNDDQYLSDFIDEARLGGMLQHPHIVQTIEVSAPGEEPFLTMEYVEGMTLRQLLTRLRQQGVRLPVHLALHIALAICDALAYTYTVRDAAGRPIDFIHRDLKPENILLGRHGEVKVTDFGIAKARTKETVTLSKDARKGTVAYMSPEQAAGGMELDTRSDLYSLGAVLFEMLTLERLYPNVGSDLPGLFLVARGQVDARLELLDGLSSPLPEIVARLLSVNREARYPSADELSRELSAVARRLPPPEVSLRQVVTAALERPEELARFLGPVAGAAAAPRVPDGVERAARPTSAPGVGDDIETAITTVAGKVAARPSRGSHREGMGTDARGVSGHGAARRRAVQTMAALAGIAAVALLTRGWDHGAVPGDGRTTHPLSPAVETAARSEKPGAGGTAEQQNVAGVGTNAGKSEAPGAGASVEQQKLAGTGTTAGAQKLAGAGISAGGSGSGEAGPTSDHAVAVPVQSTGAPAPAAKASHTSKGAPVKTAPMPSHILKPAVILQVNAFPAAEVWLDGKRVDWTPIDAIRTTEGKHALRYVTADGREKSVSVKLEPGQEYRPEPVRF